MKEITNITHNRHGGYDGICNGLPYTLDIIEESHARRGLLGKIKGKKVSNKNKKNKSDARDERRWRDRELARADIELFKVQDGDGTGLVSDWRRYRVLLRHWPDNIEFPNKDHRPVFINTDKD